jgi:hypothetical protein
MGDPVPDVDVAVDAAPVDLDAVVAEPEQQTWLVKSSLHVASSLMGRDRWQLFAEMVATATGYE